MHHQIDDYFGCVFKLSFLVEYVWVEFTILNESEEEAKACAVFSLRSAVAHLTRRNAGSPQTKVRGSNNSDARLTHDFPVFAASRPDSLLSKVAPSLPSISYVETTNRVKCRR